MGVSRRKEVQDRIVNKTTPGLSSNLLAEFDG
jgi:hypothetical protein